MLSVLRRDTYRIRQTRGVGGWRRLTPPTTALAILDRAVVPWSRAQAQTGTHHMGNKPQSRRGRGNVPPILSVIAPSGARYVLRQNPDGALTDECRRFVGPPCENGASARERFARLSLATLTRMLGLGGEGGTPSHDCGWSLPAPSGVPLRFPRRRRTHSLARSSCSGVIRR